MQQRIDPRRKPLAVVEHLNEVEHRAAHLGSGGPRLPVDQLGLEGGKEALLK